MRDGAVRNVTKRIALVRYMIDLRVTRAIQHWRGEPRFLLRGSCNYCGACCETPMINVSAASFYLKTLRWLIRAWHGAVNGFEYTGEDRRTRTLIFRCTHLAPETRRCDSYSSRPGMCRDYPRNLLYSSNPELLATCGFYALDRNADQMREALQELELPPEAMADLERRLHLREPARSAKDSSVADDTHRADSQDQM